MNLLDLVNCILTRQHLFGVQWLRNWDVVVLSQGIQRVADRLQLSIAIWAILSYRVLVFKFCKGPCKSLLGFDLASVLLKLWVPRVQSFFRSCLTIIFLILSDAFDPCIVEHGWNSRVIRLNALRNLWDGCPLFGFLYPIGVSFIQNLISGSKLGGDRHINGIDALIQDLEILYTWREIRVTILRVLLVILLGHLDGKLVAIVIVLSHVNLEFLGVDLALLRHFAVLVVRIFV